MKNKKMILSIVSLLTTLLTHASQPPLNQKSLWQKTMDAIGQSQTMYWFEKNISARLSLCSLDAGPATEEYQKLGNEAQDAVGIPKHYQVPIRRMPQESLYASTIDAITEVGAITESKAIYINEKLMNQQPYEIQRYVAFHEAIHKKYNDNSMRSLLYLSISLPGCVTLSYLPIYIATGTASIIAGVAIIIAFLKIGQRFGRYAERRADIESCYATQCSTCVQAVALSLNNLSSSVNDSRSNHGYLQNSEFSIIAQDLKEQNKMCAYHKNNNA